MKQIIIKLTDKEFDFLTKAVKFYKKGDIEDMVKEIALINIKDDINYLTNNSTNATTIDLIEYLNNCDYVDEEEQKEIDSLNINYDEEYGEKINMSFFDE